MNDKDARAKLASLHRHWCTADSIDHHLRRSAKAPEQEAQGLPAGLVHFGNLHSTWLALSVWYSLLYVVIEGWQEVGCRDQRVDSLLARKDMVDALRRFRNATFHYQGAPIPPKLLEFMTIEDSAAWLRDLSRSFKAFFEQELDIRGWIQHLKARPKIE